MFFAHTASSQAARPDRGSPGQPALVDAHYYGNVTDDYYLARQGFDFTDCFPGGMDLVAHYGKGFDNAFWNGKVTVYGDGSGVIFRELSGGLDVVAHENTHAVTQCTSEPRLSRRVGCPQRVLLGHARKQRRVLRGGAAELQLHLGGRAGILCRLDDRRGCLPAGRRRARIPEHGRPRGGQRSRRLQSERLLGSADRGFVHSNSAISNHASPCW